MWGATKTLRIVEYFKLVSIHAPVWGATLAAQAQQANNMFQSTHPCGVRPLSNAVTNALIGFQSTHPCGVRLLFKAILLDCTVSIHAPVWGATLNPPGQRLVFDVSIHAPVWGATKAGALFDILRCFNPRTRVGCDAHGPALLRPRCVSIHAPVWGATVHKCRPWRQWLFQSTHPCGVRRWMS